jgi:hypothetical protein
VRAYLFLAPLQLPIAIWVPDATIKGDRQRSARVKSANRKICPVESGSVKRRRVSADLKCAGRLSGSAQCGGGPPHDFNNNWRSLASV